jgi:hypothetical protein
MKYDKKNFVYELFYSEFNEEWSITAYFTGTPKVDRINGDFMQSAHKTREGAIKCLDELIDEYMVEQSLVIEIGDKFVNNNNEKQITMEVITIHEGTKEPFITCKTTTVHSRFVSLIKYVTHAQSVIQKRLLARSYNRV